MPPAEWTELETRPARVIDFTPDGHAATDDAFIG
jgi:hypothetical protein